MPQKKKKSKKTPTASALSVRIAYVLGGALGFLIIFQMIQFYELSNKLDFIDSLQDSQTKVIEQVSLSQSYLTEFASDLNQIREFLLLPTTDYNFTGIENELVFEEEQEDITTQVFNLVSALGEAEEREAIFQSKKLELDSVLSLGMESLDIVQTESLDGIVWMFVEQTSQTEVLELTLLYTGGVKYQMYHADISWTASDDIEDVLAELEIFPNELSTILLLIEKNKEVQAFYEGMLFPSEAFQNYLSENNLSLNARTLTDEGGEYHLMNSDGIRLASFNNHYASGNGVIVITETDTRQDIGMDTSEITTVLNFLNENIDTRTDLEVKLDERKIELSQLMVDRGFISTMESLGMTMGELVEEETRLYYPILNEEGIVLRHLVLNYSTGELSVELPDTGSEESLAEAILNLKNNTEKKTFDLPEIILASEGLVDDPESFNILLMGKHGSNVDTIIFANVNSNSRQVTLVSIPRDLWVDGRKINSYYGEFGLVQQVKTIESVLGHKIHKYILIDMYIFRDVIDLMEGVTVVLEEDLVDPTYKTCDEGVCSTLYYEAGEHHLDGTQALRIARSRYSTSDYSRAARQQIILEGIQEKARSLGFGDANALIDIMSTVLNSTETDISLDEAMRYYFRYQNFDLNRGYVLSPANVLDAVPEPVDYVTSHAIEVCLDETNPNTCTTGYALDTLQPREENWDLIPWFISSVL